MKTIIKSINSVLKFACTFTICLLITSFEEYQCEICPRVDEFSVNEYLNDSLVITSKVLKHEELLVVFENKGRDTLYLFSSYFVKNKYFDSKYLNRIDQKSKEKKLSFLPLPPYLSMVQSDRIILGENSVVTRHQNKYGFIVLTPNEKKELIIFNNDTLNLFAKDIDPKNINMYDKINWEFIKNDKNLNNYKKVIEFAVYKQINQIVDHRVFLSSPFLYNSLVRDYKVYKIENFYERKDSG